VERRLHILITGRHLEKCHAGRIYGVHPAAINQIAPIRPGDQAYLFSKVKGRICGPYEIVGCPVYLPREGKPPVWERETETGKERFRVVFSIAPAAEPVSAPIESLYGLARSQSAAFFPEDVINRSVFSFLPDDGRCLLSMLAGLPWQKALLPDGDPINIAGGSLLDDGGLKTLAAGEKIGESFVEYVLTRGYHFEEVLGAGEILWNQLRLTGERSRIDLIYKSGPTLYVIELKSGAAGRAARREVTRYAVWARANKQFLERQFPGSAPLYVQPTLIGSSCPGPTDTDKILITYALEDGSDIILRRLN
jgi:hypothetical protein